MEKEQRFYSHSELKQLVGVDISKLDHEVWVEFKLAPFYKTSIRGVVKNSVYDLGYAIVIYDSNNEVYAISQFKESYEEEKPKFIYQPIKWAKKFRTTGVSLLDETLEYLSDVVNINGFAGYLFEDGTVYPTPVIYGSEKNQYLQCPKDFLEQGLYKVLRATHVCFAVED